MYLEAGKGAGEKVMHTVGLSAGRSGGRAYFEQWWG